MKNIWKFFLEKCKNTGGVQGQHQLQDRLGPETSQASRKEKEQCSWKWRGGRSSCICLSSSCICLSIDVFVFLFFCLCLLCERPSPPKGNNFKNSCRRAQLQVLTERRLWQKRREQMQARRTRTGENRLVGESPGSHSPSIFSSRNN